MIKAQQLQESSVQHSSIVNAARVREVLKYNQKTGRFTWIKSTGPRATVGDLAGSVNVRGYYDISIDGRKYVAHRLAWLYVTGQWPAYEIDHINGDRADNRFCNLRDVPRAINTQNRRRASVGTLSKLLGVSKHGAKWRARLQTNGSVLQLGTYAMPSQAHAAYLLAKRQLHAGCTISREFL
jgi:hypothetical protein